MAPFLSTLNAISARTTGDIISWLANINDTFSRTSSGSLGTATSGQVWYQSNGTWSCSSGTATTATAASSYPFATIPFKSDVTALAKSTTSGTGVVFWQSAAGDWWAASTALSAATYYYYGTYYYCVANSCCTGSNTCAAASDCGNSSTCNYSSCCTLYYYYAACNPGWSSCGGGCCVRYVTASKTYAYYTPALNSSCNASSCCYTTYYAGTYNACCTGSNTCASNSCCSVASASGTLSDTAYNWALKLIKSIAGVVSTVLSSSTLATGTFGDTANKLNAVKVVTSGNSVTATAYSDTAGTTSLGSINTTDTTTHGKGVGIIVTPGGAQQGNTVGPFTAS